MDAARHGVVEHRQGELARAEARVVRRAEHVHREVGHGGAPEPQDKVEAVVDQVEAVALEALAAQVHARRQHHELRRGVDEPGGGRHRVQRVEVGHKVRHEALHRQRAEQRVAVRALVRRELRRDAQPRAAEQPEDEQRERHEVGGDRERLRARGAARVGHRGTVVVQHLG